MRIRATSTAAMLLGIGWSFGLGAYVNPNFTPQHVERGAKSIFSVKIAPPSPDAKEVVLDVLDRLKGEAPFKKLTLTVSQALAGEDGAENVKALLEHLRANGAEPAVIASGQFEGKPTGLLHVGGKWIRLVPGSGSEPWQFDRIDVSLNTTFNGGTDMLIETLRFVRKFGQSSIMRCDAGVSWDSHDLAGRLAGAPPTLLAVDVNGDGALDLHAVCDKGDKVWINKGAAFEECAGAAWAGRAAAWADFDRDGRLDCASIDSEGLKIFLQTSAGKFAGSPVRLPGKIEVPNPTLAVLDLRSDGAPDLVLGSGRTPLILRNLGKNPPEFEPLPLAAAVPPGWGAPGPCVVADFDGDGFQDVLQCFQKDGVLFRGRADGSFATDPGCGAAMGPVEFRRTALGDFDGNGTLEVFLSDGGAVPVLLEYRGGKFRDVMPLSGETSYIVQGGAQAVAVGDFNNDTFPDLFVAYSDQGGQFFYNRGFRSFAIAEPLRLREESVPSAEKGQTAAVWADFDKDGAQDLAFASSTGEVFVSKTTLGTKGKSPSLAVKLAPEAPCGPVNVSFFIEGRCLGTRRAEKGGAPAEMGVSEPAQYTVRFRFPGRPEAERVVEVDQDRVEVVIGAP